MAEFDLDLGTVADQARAAAYSFDNLLNVVKSFGREHAVRGLVLDLKQARQMLKGAGDNIDVVKASLKGAGVTGRDTTLIVRQLNRELDNSRKAALSASSVFKSFWATDGITNYLKHLRGVNVGFGAVKKLAGGAAGLASWGVEKGEGVFDKVLELAKYKEASIAGMGYIISKGADEGTVEQLKGMAEAKKLFAEGLQMAKRTPIADKEIVSAMKGFLTARWDPKEAFFLAKEMADQQSKQLENPEIAGNFQRTVNRMKGNFVAGLQDLNGLRSSGYSIQGVLKNLPNQPGIPELMKQYKGGKFEITGKEDEMEAFTKIRKLMSSRQISSTTLLNAAIGSNHSGHDLESHVGSLAQMKAMTTLAGATNNAENAFDNLLLSMDNATSKGGVELRLFLNKFAATIGESDSLKNSLTGVWDSILEPLKTITRADMERIIESIGVGARKLADFLRESWSWFEKMIHAKPGEFLSNAKGVLKDVGRYIGEGVYEGLKQGALPAFLLPNQGPTLEQVAADTGAGIRSAQAETRGELTDFTAMLRAGPGAPGPKNTEYEALRAQYLANSAPGVQGGLQTAGLAPQVLPSHAAGISRVPGSTGAPSLAIVHGGEAIVPASRNRDTGGRSVNVYAGAFPINISIEGSKIGDADDLEQALVPVAMRVFRTQWERLALEVGGSD